MAGLRTHGITESTPVNLLLGAGAYYRDLEVENGAWSGKVFGATSGGGTVEIVPEYLDLGEQGLVDGATVTVDGLVFKVAEKATMKVNMTELSERNLVEVLHMVEDTAASTEGYKIYKSTSNIGSDAFIKNLGYVGTLTSGEQIIIRFSHAVCKATLSLSPKNKEVATYEVEITWAAPFNQETLDYIPYEIFYPQAETV